MLGKVHAVKLIKDLHQAIWMLRSQLWAACSVGFLWWAAHRTGCRGRHLREGRTQMSGAIICIKKLSAASRSYRKKISATESKYFWTRGMFLWVLFLLFFRRSLLIFLFYSKCYFSLSTRLLIIMFKDHKICTWNTSKFEFFLNKVTTGSKIIYALKPEAKYLAYKPLRDT